MARMRGFGRPRGFRPQTDWAHWSVAGALTAGVGGADQDVFNLSSLMNATEEVASTQMPETLRRTRGTFDYSVIPDNDPADPGSLFVAAGIGVASPEAISASAVPHAFNDAFWDGWLWHDCISSPMTATANTFSMAVKSPFGVIDSRAMRKLEDNELFLAVAMQTNSGVADVVSYRFFARMLFSLSSKGR